MILIIRSAFSIRLHLSNRHVESWSDKLYSLIWVSPVSQHVARTILSSHSKAQLTNIFNTIIKFIRRPPFLSKIWKCRSNMTSPHVLYHNEILVILPRRFIKAGRVWCGDARETWEPRVTIGWLLPLREIPLNYLPAFQDLNGRTFLKISKGSKSWEKFYTIFRPWVASKINQKYALFSVP